jgi:16S rRNA (uracil1498-N3)-methyltransferase
VPSTEWRDDELVLPDDESHHALRVLRISPPDVITVTDGQGTVARCAASSIRADRLVVEVLESERRRQPRPEVIVYQGAAKGHKNDEVVERLSELGVAEVNVYDSERSVVKWDADKRKILGDRWRAVARSAAKQSRNPFVVRVGAPVTWRELVRQVSSEPLAVALWEEADLPLRTTLLEGADRVAIVIGPEGGLSKTEAEALADAGAQLASLGPLILRTEHAPVVATSAVLFHYGLIG